MAFSCRSCGSGRGLPILSLGDTPLANSLLTAEQLAQVEATFPLDVVFCADCSLVQITEIVPPESLFSDYLYFSSYSDTMLKSANELVNRLIQTRNLTSDSHVVEIASNDGYLLQYYQQVSIPHLGIEPARNIAQVAQEKGITTLCEFFGTELAQQLADEGKYADVIHANNVLAHVPDLNGVVEGFRRLLKPEGVVIVEAPYVGNLIDHVEFDTIYHEHLCYFSLTALQRQFARHAFKVVDVEQIAIHGGSLRVTFAHDNALAPADGLARVDALLQTEQARGVDQYAYYQQFAQNVLTFKAHLLDLLAQLKAEGHRIAAYGASAKGSTLLNFCGIGAETLDFVVDRSPYKQGRYTPGKHLPIFAPQQLLKQQPNYTLLLSWNFADEILEQQAEYRQHGGKFIIPLPTLRVV